MSKITLKTVRQEKAKLEKVIKDALNEFHKEITLKVESVYLNYYDLSSVANEHTLVNVETEIKLR